MLKCRYLRQARKHVCMVPLVKGYKGQLDAQQLGVGLWQPPTACHKEHKLLLQLNVPAIHNLYSSSELQVISYSAEGFVFGGGGEKGRSTCPCKELPCMFLAPPEQATGTIVATTANAV